MKRLALAVALAIVGCGGPEEEVATTSDAIMIDGINYRIISSSRDTSIVAPLRKIDTVVQAGSDPRNRFVWHKVYKLNSWRKGKVVLAPTAFADFDQYMLGPQGQGFAEKLALARYEVHGYSPRPSQLAPGACSSGAVDCSIMATWGYAAYARDLDFIRRQAGGRPAVGGWSSGAGYAIAAVNRRPNAWAGLFVGDMIMSASNPFTVEWATNACANYTGFIEAGFTWDDQTQAFLKSLVNSSEADWVSFASSDLGASFGREGFQLNASNDGATLSIANWDRLREMIQTNPDHESLAMLRDEACAWAGDDTFTGDLDDFEKPVLAVKQGLGYGPLMDHTLNLMDSDDVDEINYPSFGHLDTLAHANQTAKIANPMLNWLDSLDCEH